MAYKTLGLGMAFSLLMISAVPGAAQDMPPEEGKTLPRAIALPPPASLKPDAPLEVEDRSASLPQDQVITINNIEIVCTGTGSSRDNPQWTAYPIRVAFSNSAAQYLSGIDLRLSQDGKQIASFTCWAPWVLLRMAPGGDYKLTASLAGQSGSPRKSASFTVPASGQRGVNIAFPEVGPNQ